MNSKQQLIEELCKELMGLGINIEPTAMELILQMQEQDFCNLTKVVNPAIEFEHLLAKIKNH